LSVAAFTLKFGKNPRQLVEFVINSLSLPKVFVKTVLLIQANRQASPARFSPVFPPPSDVATRQQTSVGWFLQNHPWRSVSQKRFTSNIGQCTDHWRTFSAPVLQTARNRLWIPRGVCFFSSYFCILLLMYNGDVVQIKCGVWVVRKDSWFCLSRRS